VSAKKRNSPASRPELPEYAGTGPAIIEPSRIRARGVTFPPRAVLCFFGNILRDLERRKRARVVHVLRSEMGEHPILQIGRGAEAVAIGHPGIGSAMAAAGLEQVIALGARAVIACGGAGVLKSDLAPGTVIVPTQALRDEGTSYHYQPRSRTNRPHPDAVKAIEKACRLHRTSFVKGMTWTTDAVFRETKKKIAARRAEGCLTVEMEAAAFFAVARFRRIRFAQLLYAGDDVSGEEWDTRRWDKRPTARQKLLDLAVNAVRLL
jgi:uridine phosphorylase